MASRSSRPDGNKAFLLLDSVVLGIIGGLGAQVFMWMLNLCFRIFLIGIAGYRPPDVLLRGGIRPQAIGPHGLWLIPLSTTLGGLISGALVYGLAPETEGHGTDTVVRAFHWTAGVIRARVAPVKMIASAVTIGSGGCAGREGPIALIAAGFGSVYAKLFRRGQQDSRYLILMGMAAGLAPIFRSPIGTAIFAVQVLYGGTEFEAEALLYCMLSAIVAYAVNAAFVGWQPLFHVSSNLGVKGISDYGRYIALGGASGLVAAVFPQIFYGMRDVFAAIRIPSWTKPGLGGLALGLMALRLPQVLAGGYGWIQEAIDGKMVLHLLLILLVAKMVALALTVSSGGSGGVFAPSLFVGAMLGGAFAVIFHQPAQGFVIVGMASVFGAAARVPIATLLMVAEMTGGYQLLVPAALALTLSFLIQRQLSSLFKYGSLYEAQVAGRIDSPAHRAEQVRVAPRLLERGQITLPSEVTHLHLANLLQSGLGLDLPDGSQLVVGALRPESPWAGKQIRSRHLTGTLANSTIIGVLRGKSVMTVRPDTILQPGDRILMITPQDARAELQKHLVPAQQPQPNQSQPSAPAQSRS